MPAGVLEVHPSVAHIEGQSAAAIRDEDPTSLLPHAVEADVVAVEREEARRVVLRLPVVGRPGADAVPVDAAEFRAEVEAKSELERTRAQAGGRRQLVIDLQSALRGRSHLQRRVKIRGRRLVAVLVPARADDVRSIAALD